MKEYHYAKDGLASTGRLMELKPEIAASLVTFDQQVFEDGALASKIKELIAVGAAHVTRCPTVLKSIQTKPKNWVQRMKKSLRLCLWVSP